MARKTQIADIKSFVGGLNYRADQFQLRVDESPGMLNIDIDPRGGFKQREGIATLTRTSAGDLMAAAASAITYFNHNGAEQFVASAGDGVNYTEFYVWRADGTKLTQVGPGDSNIDADDDLVDGLPIRGAVFDDATYLVNRTMPCQKWNGTTTTGLGAAWSNDITAPSGANMPRALVVAAHAQRLWVANTVEAAAHPNRVRWSHPGNGENWRENDFIDVDTGVDNDEITALLPFGEQLLVFKGHATYVITGYDNDTFAVSPLTRDVGAVSQEAVCSSPRGAWFFSAGDGVYQYDGRGLSYHFAALRPAMDDGRIDAGTGPISLCWHRDRLWVTTPWESDEPLSHPTAWQSQDHRRTFVYDSSLGKAGAWMAHDIQAWSLCGYISPDQQPTLVVSTKIGYGGDLAYAEGGAPYDLYADEDAWDVLDDSAKPITHLGPWPIVSYYTTAWMDGGLPAAKKRWRRPRIVIQSEFDAVIPVEVYTDYDMAQVRRNFSVNVSGLGDNLRWTNAGADVGQWGSGQWGAWRKRYDIDKVTSLGSSHAVQLIFRCPQTVGDWGINAITLPFETRKVT